MTAFRGVDLKIGLLGCGNIGLIIAKAVDSGVIRGTLSIVYDIDPAKSKKLASTLKKKPRIADSFEKLLDDAEIIVEAASQKAVREHALKALTAGKHMLVMSAGALLDEKLFQGMVSAAEKNSANIYVPSGAVCGIDGVKSASVGGIKSVLLQTTKNPHSIKGFEHIRRRRVIFDGPASKAVKLFPANINVSAILSLAGIGAQKTRVRIVADPKVKRNTHEIFVSGEFGRLYSRADNMPSPDNPKTSYLACLSAIKTLNEIECAVRIGT